ncbi:hypothetical protein HEQ75_19705 [Roseomonas sp. BU-1]|uniref:Uncharacterized protein n=1 Tax=Falsiroseomonas selenitidurans TaxID=2716335 RepID=A0ABX1EBF8_9PROT|nr:hypothetical protein [Falsiroseomonas selenitidurans]
MHISNDRAPTQLNTNGSMLPEQTSGPTATREPLVSGLTRDEIRRIVLDLIG